MANQIDSQHYLPDNIGKEELLTVEEVAAFLRLKPGTIRSMAKQRKIPALKIGKGWRFKKSEIHKLLE